MIYTVRSVRFISCIFIFCLLNLNIYSQQVSKSAVAQNSKGNVISPESTSANDSESASTDTNLDNSTNNNLPDETQFIIGNQNANEVNFKSLGAWDYIRVFFILFLVIFIGVAVIWFLKRLQNPSVSTNSELIEIISTRSLSQGSLLHLVKVANGYILIGNAGQSVSNIKEFFQKEEIDEINLQLSKAEENKPKNQKQNFYQKLTKRLGIHSSLSTLSNPSKSIQQPLKKNTSLLGIIRGTTKE